MPSLIVFMLIIFSFSLVAACYGKRVEFTFPIGCMATIPIMLIVGMVSNLLVGLIVLCVFNGGLLLFTGYQLIVKNKFKVFRKSFVTPSLGVILFYLFFFLWCDIGMQAGNSSDDFTHWVYIVKEMVNLNDFGTNPSAEAMFASYPPGMALFQYVFCKVHLLSICGGNIEQFSEWRCFFAYHLLIFSVMLPFFSKIEVKSFPIGIIKFICLFLIPTQFSMAYYGLSIETALSVLAGVAFARIILEENKDELYTIYIVLTCFSLVLFKDSGIAMAVFIAIAFISDRIICSGATSIKAVTVPSIAVITGVVLPKILWNIQLSISKVNISFSQTVSLQILWNVLIGKDVSYRRNVLHNFIEALFYRTPTVEIPWSSEDRVYPTLPLSYVALALILFTIMFFALSLLKKYYCGEKEGRASKATAYIFISWFIIYILGIGVTYICNFNQSEAEMLASFSRYVQVPYCICSIVVFLIVFTLIERIDRYVDYAAVVLFSLLLITCPREYFIHYVDRGYVSDSFQRRLNYQKISDDILENCSQKDKICIIDQEEWLYPYLVIRFNIRPIYSDSINGWSTWRITESSSGDEDSLEWFRSKLEENNYDYVVVFNTDDYLISTYNSIFEDEITGNSLYQYDTTSRMLRKIGN